MGRIPRLRLRTDVELKPRRKTGRRAWPGGRQAPLIEHDDVEAEDVRERHAPIPAGRTAARDDLTRVRRPLTDLAVAPSPPGLSF